MAGLDLAKVVSVKETYEWTETEWKLGSGYGVQITPKFHVVAFDYGVKKQHPAHDRAARLRASPWCRRRRPPPTCSSCKPDGVFLANGPGDPEPCDYAIDGHAQADRDRHPDLRHLPGPPDHGAGLGRQDLQDEVRPPRRQPSGEGPGQRPRQHHQPEPRLRGRREVAAGQPARHAHQPVRRHAAGPRPHRQARRSASRATRRPRPARTTSATCSTASRR